MPVETNGSSEREDPAPAVEVGGEREGQEGTGGSPPRRISALLRVAGTIPPEGSEVERSLEEFIAQANSTQVDMAGWKLSDEQAARAQAEWARREQEAREAARAAAEAARAAAEVEAERRLKAFERRSSEEMALLKARLAEAEERAREAEKRARTASGATSVAALDDPLALTEKVPPLRRRSRAAPAILSVAIGVVGLGIILVLVGRGRLLGAGDQAAIPAPKPAAAPAPARPAATVPGAAPLDRARRGPGRGSQPDQAAPSPPVAAPPAAPAPVVRSMLPAEPNVTPLEDRGPARVRPARRPRRPAAVAPSTPPDPARVDIESSASATTPAR